ncbi:hypothetical protein ZIOFF_075337 [Zingiber officinale]|uniref:RING-type E3 ubiquitin transferase n=1 Tax=Zingiber officinale TaxID=94328 RepID=A0A8J5C1E3_ZINOF|nr:hypothetical protein ZIOFF_075337 [Zingiber officinale]
MGRRKSGGTKAEADSQKSHGLALGIACVVGDRMGVDGEEMEENAESSNLDDSPLIGADNTSAGLRLNAEKKSTHEVSYSFLIHELLLVAILSEGIYNAQTGLLCMVGCGYVASLVAKQQMERGEIMDSEIIISIQFAPLKHSAGDKITGTIGSTRDKMDPLFFEPFGITSSAIYTEQAIQSIWRMDVEIIMVMISLTLSCFFVGLQLLHVKKNQEVLPSISIIMLIILTLGNMIPLVLYYYATLKVCYLKERERKCVWCCTLVHLE